MSHKYVLGIENDSVKTKMKTEQFKLSEILLDKKFYLGATIEEMAIISGCSTSDYMDLEYGETDIPIESYKLAIKNIKSYEMEL